MDERCCFGVTAPLQTSLKPEIQKKQPHDTNIFSAEEMIKYVSKWSKC